MQEIIEGPSPLRFISWVNCLHYLYSRCLCGGVCLGMRVYGVITNHWYFLKMCVDTLFHNHNLNLRHCVVYD